MPQRDSSPRGMPAGPISTEVRQGIPFRYDSGLAIFTIVPTPGASENPEYTDLRGCRGQSGTARSVSVMPTSRVFAEMRTRRPHVAASWAVGAGFRTSVPRDPGFETSDTVPRWCVRDLFGTRNIGIAQAE